jgi:hypothetical protein
MSEQAFGATITCTTIGGRKTMIRSLPKKQARRIYTYAQEIEEQMVIARRQSELERLRASAGGVVIQSPAQASAPAGPSKEDPVELLSQLKRMLDGGLIQPEEYDAKKTEILSRM